MLKRRPGAGVLSALSSVFGGVAVFLFVLTYSVAPYFSYLPGKGASEEQFKSRLDRAAPWIIHHFGIPGVVVATVVHGMPSATYTYGYADVKRRTPMAPDTVFRVASISKSLTAWGILRLAEAGKIDLDGPADQYLGGWPLPQSAFPSKSVTVRQLLSHSSGLNAGVDTFRRPDERVQSARELLLHAGPPRAGHPGPAALVAPAGRSFIYSVPGYTILQMIIETQSAQSFGDYMKTTVLRPLGMTSSSFDWDQSLRRRTATPYLTDGRPSPVLIPQDLAADSLFTTAADLARFIAAPLPDGHSPIGGGVLGASSVNQLYQEPVDIPSLQLAELGPARPALGYFVEEAPGQPAIVTNGGYDPGWSARFYMAPSTGDGIAILTNSDRAQPVIAQIASIWAAWRGLPSSKMTRAYRSLGIKADSAISLLVMLGISFAISFGTDMRAGTRRLGAYSRQALTASLMEGSIAVGIAMIWLVAYRALRAMPTLNAVSLGAICFFVVVVVARTMFPVVAVRTVSTGFAPNALAA